MGWRTCFFELVVGHAAGHEGLDPVDGLEVVDLLARVEEDVKQLVEAVGLVVDALGVDVGRSGDFALVEQHPRRRARRRGHRERRLKVKGLWASLVRAARAHPRL